MRRRLTAASALALALGMFMVPAAAQEVGCVVHDTSTKSVVEGVELTWTNSFWCADAAANGTYQIEVTVTNNSAQSVDLNQLFLSHTTPRPGGQGPAATASTDGLPQTIAAGGTAAFMVTGSYELVVTDEGPKANLHLRVHGDVDGEPFALGVNVHLRGVGAVEENGGVGGPDNGEGAGAPFLSGTDWPADGPSPGIDGSDDNGEGPPFLSGDAGGWTPGTPGPPPWAGSDSNDEGPPANLGPRGNGAEG